MDIRKTLDTLCSLAGPSGFERAVAEQAVELMRPYVDEAAIDRFGNAIGVRLCGRPGAKKLLLNRDCRAALERIRRRMTYVQFGEMDKFVENMVSAQFIPHTDAKQYPSVKRKR